MMRYRYAVLLWAGLLLGGCGSDESEGLTGAGGATTTTTSTTTWTTTTTGSAGAGGGGGAATSVRWLDAEVHFATAAEANELLGTVDDYLERHSDFDRSVRMGTPQSVTLEEFRAFAGSQGVDWEDDQRVEWAARAEQLGQALAGLSLELPSQVLVIQATGDDEFGYAYTRGNAIVFPTAYVDSSNRPFWLLAHELFHVATRHRPTVRDSLYPILGFASFGGLTSYPESLEAQRMTNPDAFSLVHYLPVTLGTETKNIVPLFQSSIDLASALAASPHDWFDFPLLEVDPVTGDAVVDGEGAPSVMAVADTDYAEKVGLNTDYILHPEEALADNFALLMQRRLGEVVSLDYPEVVDSMEEALGGP